MSRYLISNRRENTFPERKLFLVECHVFFPGDKDDESLVY